MIPLRIFIGYDSQEVPAYHVLAHSILVHASRPVAIIPLVRRQLAEVYKRERNRLESTEFSLTRFLVPYLSGYEGWSLFMDCDMLARCDLTDLWLDAAMNEDKAVLVCQHDYVPKTRSKMEGQIQTRYPRKNWSSLMLFNNAKCQALSPDYINQASALVLQRFAWVEDDKIGSLPLLWNWLIGEYPNNEEARVFHYTLGGPWLKEYEHCDGADEWREALEDLGSGLMMGESWQKIS